MEKWDGLWIQYLMGLNKNVFLRKKWKKKVSNIWSSQGVFTSRCKKVHFNKQQCFSELKYSHSNFAFLFRSQLSCVLSSCFVAIAFVALRSTFEYIPLAVLAAVIFAALKKLFTQFRDIPRLYKASKQELAVWLTTFLASLCFSSEIG